MNYEVYCDESCWEALFNKSSHKYTVIGGIWIRAEFRDEIKSFIKALKSKYGLHGELKWNRVCPSSIELYKELIDFFFDNGNVRFRAICIKTEDVNNDRFNEGNGELGFYKFYFQLLNNWVSGDHTYAIFIDHKVNGYQHRVHDLKRILGYTSVASISQVQALPSEESLLIQMADVLIGAVAAAFNNATVKSESKQTIIAQIKDRIGHDIKATSSSEDKFNIFCINLKREW